jgi:hypothetical protein
MTRRLLLIAVAMTIGVAPIAHEFCQVSCAAPVVSTQQASHASAGHEHCAQAARDDPGGAAKMSAAHVSDCRSQGDDALWTVAFARTAAPAPAILVQSSDGVPLSTRVLVRVTVSAPPSTFVPARTQLRV